MNERSGAGAPAVRTPVTPLTALVQSVREGLLGTADSVCLERARLVTEAWQRHDGEARVLVRAQAFRHLLASMSLDLDSNPVFAGNTSSRTRAWMLIPEHGIGYDGQVLLENPCVAGLLDQVLPADLAAFWQGRALGGLSDPGHLAVDLDLVVHQGLTEVLRRLEARRGEGSPAQCQYREAMALTLQAVNDWASRYAQAAEEAARREPEPLRRRCHERVAAACRRVPAEPARDLFEGLQAVVLVHLALAIEGHGMSVSIGLPDRVLAPFAAEAATPEAVDLIAAFMLKLAANSVFGRASKTQSITVGGADHLGRDCSNALTRAFLLAADRVRLGDPPVFLRWHPGLPPDLAHLAAQLLGAGLSQPLLLNDVVTAKGFEGGGVAPEHAWRYCVIGCNELGVPGWSAESANARAGSVPYVALLNAVLLGLPDPDRVSGMDELLRLLEAGLGDCLRQARRHYRTHLRHLIQQAPVPFTSALMQGCVAAGADLLEAMPYRVPGLYERGFSNAVNALAAIDTCVFRERALTLAGIVAAMRADFAGAEGLRQCLRAAPKWGQGAPAAERWAQALLEARERVLDQIDREFGDPSHAVCHVVRSLHHLDGSRLGASADGRHAGMPLADSIGADAGTACNGPTGVLNSVATIDASRCYRGGYNLNLALPAGRTQPAELWALVEAFFGRGGQELQINCLDAVSLRAAQAHPEQHGDLVVRVAGLSARFVDLPALEQDELIARAEAL
jgi:formate C-acetyltransferase